MTRELLKQALDALELQEPALVCPREHEHWRRTALPAMNALRAHLAQPYIVNPISPVAEAYEMEDGTVAILAYPGADFQIGARFYTTPPIDGFGGNLDEAFDAPVPAAPLTDEQIDALWRAPMSADWEHREFARAIERHHGITGGGK